jgi:arylsulfatase A-like enzyme
MVVRIIVLLLFVALRFSAIAQDKPNFLFLVTEDMSPYLSCYGNKLIKTPNLDRLASQGIRFTQAHSNGTQCSPSRSTLISGKYAISLGTDIHREKRPFNDSFYFPIYLRQAGYYCTNNPKEDYNNQKTPSTVWNQSNNKAHYISRPDKKQPFFAEFNQGTTHMTRVATRTTAGRGKRVLS